LPSEKKCPALVLDDIGVAALDGGQLARSYRPGTPFWMSQKLKLYGVPHPDRRHFPGRVLRPVDVGGQPNAVGHRHHHLALDDGDRLQLGLRVDAALPVGGAERALLRRGRARRRTPLRLSIAAVRWAKGVFFLMAR